MSSNKYTTIITSEILKNKLSKIIEKLQVQSSPSATNTSLITYEQLLSEATKSIASFYKDLSAPKFDPNTVFADTEPSIEDYNTNFNNIFDDLSVLFEEFENIESVTLGNFNYMVSRLNRLNSRLKIVSSKVSDYILFSENKTKDAIFLGDSFNNLTKIEENSSLLNAEQCDINQTEGIITLPVDKIKQKIIQIKNTPVINSNSNGIAGNSLEPTRSFNGDISVIIDNNADTWFEYERIPTNGDDNIPLILELTINLGQEQIINHIKINPNNFGTRTQISIEKIDTSIDGKTFISIKDDIPIAGWIVKDEDNIFTLAPSSSKYAGQGLFTFTPRKAKYIRCSFKQNTPYPVGTKMRYAIGIRDITIEALPFKTDGEIVSTNFISLDEIKKVILLSNQNPDSSTESELANIKHYISIDNGVTWNEIRPYTSSGLANTSQEIPELLNFNTIDASSISTVEPVTTIRYKAKLNRNSEAFTNNNAELNQETATTTELHSVPSTTPFNIQLQQQPIKDSITILDPNFGSRELLNYKYDIATGIGEKIEIVLPWNNLPIEYQKDMNGNISQRYAINMFVNDEMWTQNIPSGSNKYFKVQTYPQPKLVTGDGTTGACPKSGQTISINFNRERLYPSVDNQHICRLEYPCIPDKTLFKIIRQNPFVNKSIIIPKGLTVIQLEGDPLYFTPGETVSLNSINFTIVAFINGISEFTVGLNQLSIDYSTGKLFLSRSIAAAGGTEDATLIYGTSEYEILSDDDFDIVDNLSIAIKDNQYQTIKKTFYATNTNTNILSICYYDRTDTKYYTMPQSTTPFGAINYDGFALKKGSINITIWEDLGAANSFEKEVAYINGCDEFKQTIKTTELIDTTNFTGSGVISFPINLHIIASTTYKVSFSDTDIFKQEVGTLGEVYSSVGNYYVKHNLGTTQDRIYVNISAATDDAGNIYYYCADPRAEDIGLYSVDYKLGLIYTSKPINNRYAFEFENTMFYAYYPIGREINPKYYTLDTANKIISIKDTEILNNQRTKQLTDTSGKTKFYQVSYKYVKDNRKDVSELEPFFTPILKDYTMKLITKSKMI